jgi:flavoprotein
MSNKTVEVYVVTEADEVMGVYTNKDEAERMCNSYYDAEVSEAFTLVLDDD